MTSNEAGRVQNAIVELEVAVDQVLAARAAARMARQREINALVRDVRALRNHVVAVLGTQ